MFLQVSVNGGGRAWLPGGCVRGCQGACMAAMLGGMHGCREGMHGCRGHAWLRGGGCVVARGHAWLPGGMRGCQGACMVAGGHAWLWGVCVVVGGTPKDNFYSRLTSAEKSFFLVTKVNTHLKFAYKLIDKWNEVV